MLYIVFFQLMMIFNFGNKLSLYFTDQKIDEILVYRNWYYLHLINLIVWILYIYAARDDRGRRFEEMWVYSVADNVIFSITFSITA